MWLLGQRAAVVSTVVLVAALLAPSSAFACGAACGHKYPKPVTVEQAAPAPAEQPAPVPTPPAAPVAPAPPGPPQHLDRVTICVHEQGLVLPKLIRGGELDVWLTTHPLDFRQPEGGDCGVTRPEAGGSPQSAGAPVPQLQPGPLSSASLTPAEEGQHPQQPLPGAETVPAQVVVSVPAETPAATPAEAAPAPAPLEGEAAPPAEVVVPAALPAAGDGSCAEGCPEHD